MLLSKTKRGIRVRLSAMPTESQLDTLNANADGKFYVCDKRGYDRLLHATGEGHSHVVMECPINEYFYL